MAGISGPDGGSVTWQRIDLAAPEWAVETPRPTIAGLLYRGQRHIISGPPEALKTLLSWVFGLEADELVVAHIDFEVGAARSRLMLDDLGASLDWIRSVYHVEPEGPPTPEDVQNLLDAGVGLVILDAAVGAYATTGLDDNSRLDAEQFAAAWITPLWDAGMTTVVIDHVVKNAETRGRFAIGSERKVGQADVHLGIEVVETLSRGGNGLVRVRVHKDRSGYLPRPYAAEIAFTSDPGTHALTWELRPVADEQASAPWRPTVQMERVSRHLVAVGEPLSRSRIAREVTGKREHVLTAIDCLVAEGYAEEHKGPSNARLVTSARPFTVGPSPVPDPSPTLPQGRDNRSVPGSPPLRAGTGNGSRHVPSQTTRLHLGDPGYPLKVDGEFAAGHITATELADLIVLDGLAARARRAKAGLTTLDASEAGRA